MHPLPDADRQCLAQVHLGAPGRALITGFQNLFSIPIFPVHHNLLDESGQICYPLAIQGWNGKTHNRSTFAGGGTGMQHSMVKELPGQWIMIHDLPSPVPTQVLTIIPTLQLILTIQEEK